MTQKAAIFRLFMKVTIRSCGELVDRRRQNAARSSRSQLSIFSDFQCATSVEDFVASSTPDLISPCSAIAPSHIRELIHSELSRMNEIKSSLVSNQMSDSMILSEVMPPARLNQMSPFFTSRILPPGHF
jgi:hypothetical protein